MLRIVLIGPGDIKFHYHELLKMSDSTFNQHIDAIASALTSFALVLLPDKGAPFEVAKRYKALGGSRILGTVPLSDKTFGTKHLQLYIDAEVSGKKLIDSIIDTGDWYKQDMTLCLFGDVVLLLGSSLGSLGELAYGLYLYKLGAKNIHPEIRAGKSIPFSIIIYKPFIKTKLSPEIEAYIKKSGCKLYYVNDAKELKSILARISI